MISNFEKTTFLLLFVFEDNAHGIAKSTDYDQTFLSGTVETGSTLLSTKNRVHVKTVQSING